MVILVKYSITLGIGTGALITVGLVLYATFSKAFEEQLLANFAASNGYAYQKDGTVDETYGTLFTFHGSRAVSDVITGPVRRCAAPIICI